MNKRHSEEDGITHINAYSKGKTKLGRMLSNMSDIGIDHPEYGKFKTLEGFYWWLKTGRETDFFRTGSGFECRNLGQELSEFYVDFDIKIMCRGIIFKILSNIELLQLVQKITYLLNIIMLMKMDPFMFRVDIGLQIH